MNKKKKQNGQDEDRPDETPKNFGFANDVFVQQSIVGIRRIGKHQNDGGEHAGRISFENKGLPYMCEHMAKKDGEQHQKEKGKREKDRQNGCHRNSQENPEAIVSKLKSCHLKAAIKILVDGFRQYLEHLFFVAFRPFFYGEHLLEIMKHKDNGE